jgi:hypothetical protein
MWSFKELGQAASLLDFINCLHKKKQSELRQSPIINLSIINLIGLRNRPAQPIEPT